MPAGSDISFIFSQISGGNQNQPFRPFSSFIGWNILFEKKKSKYLIIQARPGRLTNYLIIFADCCCESEGVIKSCRVGPLQSAPSSPLHYMKLPDCHTSNTQNCCRTAEPSQHYSQQPSVLTNFIYTCYHVTMLVAILSFCQKSSFMYKSRIWQITTVFFVCVKDIWASQFT